MKKLSQSVRDRTLWVVFAVLLTSPVMAAEKARVWPEPTPPVIAGSDGYVEIPDAAVTRDPARVYKALFDATTAAPDHKRPLPAFTRVALQINGLVAAKVPAENIHFVMILHGPAGDALLTDAEYRKKHKIDNPNRQIFQSLRQAGVRMLVCGQYMARANLALSQIMEGVEVAEAATLVQISYANDGYAVLTN